MRDERFFDFRARLTRGEIRAAEKLDGRWTVNAWVKQGILLGFRLGELKEMSDSEIFLSSTRTLPCRRLSLPTAYASSRAVQRFVKELTWHRPSSACARCHQRRRLCRRGTMVDSHALVGSCAQIGKRVI